MIAKMPKPWSARAQVTLGFLAILILVGGFGYWSVASNIAGAIIAPGQIEVDRNRQIVQHPDGGVVDAIMVDEGDMVEAGDLLIRLDPNRLQSELTVIEGQLFEMMARRGRMEAERDGTADISFDTLLLEAAAGDADVQDLVQGQSRLFAARRETEAQTIETLEKRREQTQNQVDGIEAQEDSLARQLALIFEELDSQRTLLERGLAQASRVLNLEREAARLEGQIGELAANKAQAQGRMTEIDLEIVRLSSTRREEAITELRDLRSREFELAERRRATRERLEQTEIRAPVSGVVYGLEVQTVRAVISPADPVLYLVPQDRPLVIAARVEPINIDELFVGQEVILRFSALDQRQTPELYGEVSLVSPDAFEDPSTGAPYYSAEVILAAGQAERLPEGTTLIPGMPVETFIRTSDRSPLAYLVKPLADYFTRAFRES